MKGRVYISLLFVSVVQCSNSCLSTSSVYGSLEGVCVCTADECHTIPELPKLEKNQAAMFTTSKAGKRFEPTIVPMRLVENGGKYFEARVNVDLKLDVSFEGQSIIGFGGSFNDASAINLFKMKPKVREEILKAYYGDSGLQYTLARIPMASTDFSESVYSYNDNDGDLEMKHFSIDTDKEPNSHKLTMIHDAMQLSKRNITMFASPWAPPAWMTVENSTLNCHVKGYPGEEYWKSWALYFSKFIQAYKEEGVDIWAVTTQNEPVRQPLQFKHWQSQRFNTTTERDWIKRDLGPLLKKDHPNVHIIVMDDQKDGINNWTAALDDPEASKYVSGTGFHWYQNIDFILWNKGNFEDLAKKHEQHPDKFLLATEACEGFLPSIVGTGSGVRITEPNIIWKRAENYARDIIGDLQNWSTGWTDWNLVLDRDGGPNWARNFVDAPIIADTESGEEYYKQPMYYAMGHFSKYISKGSKRIGVQVLKNVHGIQSVAFLTPENHYVVALQHFSGWIVWQNKEQPFKIQVGNRVVSGTLDKDSIATLVIPVVE